MSCASFHNERTGCSFYGRISLIIGLTTRVEEDGMCDSTVPDYCDSEDPNLDPNKANCMEGVLDAHALAGGRERAD